MAVSLAPPSRMRVVVAADGFDRWMGASMMSTSVGFDPACRNGTRRPVQALVPPLPGTQAREVGAGIPPSRRLPFTGLTAPSTVCSGTLEINASVPGQKVRAATQVVAASEPAGTGDGRRHSIRLAR